MIYSIKIDSYVIHNVNIFIKENVISSCNFLFSLFSIKIKKFKKRAKNHFFKQKVGYRSRCKDARGWEDSAPKSENFD